MRTIIPDISSAQDVVFVIATFSAMALIIFFFIYLIKSFYFKKQLCPHCQDRHEEEEKKDFVRKLPLLSLSLLLILFTFGILSKTKDLNSLAVIIIFLTNVISLVFILSIIDKSAEIKLKNITRQIISAVSNVIETLSVFLGELTPKKSEGKKVDSSNNGEAKESDDFYGEFNHGSDATTKD